MNMNIQLYNFFDKSGPMTQSPPYSQVWTYLRNNFGNPINTAHRKMTFLGRNNETAILTDNTPKSNLHQLILIDVSNEISKGLKELIDSFD